MVLEEECVDVRYDKFINSQNIHRIVRYRERIVITRSLYLFIIIYEVTILNTF